MESPFFYPATRVFSANETYRHGRGPILRRLRDGSLFCAIYSGGPREPDPSNLAIFVRSLDDGETWSEPAVWFQNTARPCLPGEITVMDERTLALVMTYNADCYYREARIHLSWLQPDGNWSEPYSLPGPFSNQIAFGRGIRLQNGAWLWPTFYQETASGWDFKKDPFGDDTAMTQPMRCGVIQSADGGHTFVHHGRIAHEGHCLWEPACVELEPGHVVMLMRAEYAGQLHRSDSHDSGVTWSPPVPTGIPNPNSKPEFLRVRDSVVLFHNPNPNAVKRGPNRMPLAVWVSHDGMKTWAIQKDLCPKDVPFFYSSAFGDDARETVYVVTENARQHYLMKIPYADLGIQ